MCDTDMACDILAFALDVLGDAHWYTSAWKVCGEGLQVAQ